MVLHEESLNYKYETSTEEVDRKFWEYFDVNSEDVFPTNVSLSRDLSEPLSSQMPVLVTYGFLFAVGAAGNAFVLGGLTKARRRKSRVDLLMTHLAMADIFVTCGVIPLEVGWRYTNAWLAGNYCCKFLQVLRAFGLYLSSNVLVCISLDRFFAVLYPLRLSVARRRSQQMLLSAWIFALACSLPQSLIFSVRSHPRIPGFEQCVSFGALSYSQEIAYNVFCLLAVYFLPLIIITVCYVCIFCEIHKNSKELNETCVHRSGLSHVHLRRSGRRLLERARRRTLRMTVTIVCVFALCWLPYATMALWYQIDRNSAYRVSRRVQDLLFVMAVSNSCMNPLVYGSYALDLRRAVRRLFKNTCCASSSLSDTIGNSGSSSTKNKNQHLEAPLVIKNGRVRPRLGVRFADTSLTVDPERLEPVRPTRRPA